MATIGTRLYTLLCGALVGEDDAGNRYYRERRGRPGPGERERRWVVYEGEVEASRVPPEWHRWLHHSTDEPPTEAPLRAQPWEKPHQPNLTGSPSRLPAAGPHPGPRRDRATALAPGSSTSRGSPTRGRPRAESRGKVSGHGMQAPERATATRLK